jgi:hypothetical protein
MERGSRVRWFMCELEVREGERSRVVHVCELKGER